MSYTRKSFSGNAVATTLSASISSTDLTIQVGATTGFPSTASGDFIVTIDRGTTSEEKVLISSYTSTTLTVPSGGRGQDGTTAQSHTSGATLAHTLDAGTVNNHETFVAGNGTVAPTASAVGDASANGTSSVPAAADHKHARESFATGDSSSSAPGDAASDGTSTSPARADHKHAREAWGSSESTEVAATAADGTSTHVARADHVHSGLGQPIGLTGATAATRFVGGTTTGAPASGTFSTGDFVVTQDGVVWVCTVGGSPGTWVSEPAIPRGRLYGVSYNIIASGTGAQVTGLTTDFASGGVTVSNSDELIVPVNGIYRVSWSLCWNNNGSGVSAGGNFEAQLYQNSSRVRVARFAYSPPAFLPTPNASSLVSASANDSFAIYGYQTSGSSQYTCYNAAGQGGSCNYLELELVERT